MNKKEVFKISISILIIVFSIISLCVIGSYGTKFFRDFQIIYDGGYRVYQDQIPNKDFSIPTGPIVFYFQGFVQKIFGPTPLSLAMHVAILSIILAIVFYFIIRKYYGEVFSIFLSVCLYYSYNGVVGNPWYNQMANFFLLLNLLIIIICLMNKKFPLWVYFVTPLLSVLSFYSKQDTGILQFMIFGFLIFYMDKKRNYKKNLSYVFTFIFLMLLTKLLFRLTGIVNSSMVNQATDRLLLSLSLVSVNMLIYAFTFYITLFTIYLFFKEKQKDNKDILMIIILFNSIITILQVTSGLGIQTKIIGLPITLFLFYLYLSNLKFKFNIKSKIIYFIMFMTILMQFNDLNSMVLNHYFTTPVGQFNNILKGDNKINEGCYKDKLFYTEKDVKTLDKIREIIKDNDNSFIVFGDFQFLYCDYNVMPPKGFPLWLHEGITISKSDIININKNIETNKPKVIVSQIYSVSDEIKYDFYKQWLILGYEEVIKFDGPEINADKVSEIKIFVLKK